MYTCKIRFGYKEQQEIFCQDSEQDEKVHTGPVHGQTAAVPHDTSGTVF